MIRTIKNRIHLIESFISNAMYGFPSGKMKIIGVTGTDGKTTTTNLIYHILITQGYKVAMISTVGAVIGGKKYDTGFHVTTPSSFLLQRYIKKALDEGSEYLILEVTSHALDQNRAWGIKFEIGLITNITREHLDYHKTYDNYVGAKLRLLKSSKNIILNRDDESYNRVVDLFADKTLKVTTFGLKNEADVTIDTLSFHTNLLGEFNRYNILAAVAVCKILGVSDPGIQEGVESFKPPLGRQEMIYSGDFKVMVDFAHTPNAFDQLLPELFVNVKGRLIHVFGSAGRRDLGKRAVMGEIASKYDSIIILTAEDPRDEDIDEINRQIAERIRGFEFGISSDVKLKEIKKDKKYLFDIPDRREAIEFAIRIARRGDMVIITGKGHERSMNLGAGEEKWDEFNVISDALKKRNEADLYI